MGETRVPTGLNTFSSCDGIPCRNIEAELFRYIRNWGFSFLSGLGVRIRMNKYVLE